MKKLIMTALVAFAGVSLVHAQTSTAKPAENKNQAEISFDKEVHDFGVIPQNQPATYMFYFQNTGKEPLIITNASASCGCTTPEWSKEPIAPGKKGYVKATFNAAAIGPFSKNVTVMSNGKRGTVVLTLKGDVKVPTNVTPTTPSGHEGHNH